MANTKKSLMGLPMQMLIGLVLGVVVGMFVTADFAATWFKPLGDLFIRLIRMVVVPLVFATLVAGAAGISDVSKLGRVAVKTLLFFMGTSALAVAAGLIVANFIAYGLCLYSIKALYFSTIDEVMIPKRLAGTASGIISLLAYAPEMFLYTVSAQMVDKYVGTSTPLAGYVHCFIWMAVLSAIGFVSAIVLRRLNNKAIAAAKAAAAE